MKAECYDSDLPVSTPLPEAVDVLGAREMPLEMPASFRDEIGINPRF